LAKIVFIGAGSLGFTRTLIRDLLTFPALRDATLSLVDINAERLEFAKRAAEKIIELGEYPAKVEAVLDRRKALKGADAVVITILSGGVKVWRHDIEIPMKYGVDVNIGDTRGPSGVFRYLRTVPEMLAICKDVERLAPDAIVLNYTNPMAMLCRSVQRVSDVKFVGLCHSVQHTVAMLAQWLNVPKEEVTYECAGINHMAWFLRYEHNFKDMYPRLRQLMKNKRIYYEEVARNEMFLNLGYYVTESSGHNTEYNWWFRKTPEHMKRYCLHGKEAFNPGEHAYILKEYMSVEKTWKKDVKDWFKKKDPIPLEKGDEYAASIINARVSGEPFKFYGNVPNKNLITNLPPNSCVEVPVLADRSGFHPIQIGQLPASVAVLTNLTAQIEDMAVEGALTGDPTLIYQSILHDPLTASVLSFDEVRKMVQEMFRKNRKYLTTFKTIKF